MKFNILHILVVVSISGVISGDDNGIVINGNNNTDVPTASTVNPNITTSPLPPTTSTADPNTTTTVDPNNTTTTPVPTTSPITPSTTPSPPTPSPNSTTTSTTTPSNVTSTTESTTSVPTSAPSHKGRRFDGPSFIGGIILASGLMAICFVSWKFYKARTERNYHTL